MSDQHPDSLPRLDITDLDARAQILTLAPVAFERSSTDDARHNVLGMLLALVEEDRVLEGMRAQNERLAILQAHKIENGLPIEDEEPVYDLLPDEEDDEDDSEPIAVTIIRAIRDDEDDEEGDVV